MSAKPHLPLAEVNRRAFEVLHRELGPGDTARFIGQFTTGSGDYTVDREKLFAGMSVDDLYAEMKAMNGPSQQPAAHGAG